jgi:hypothetical protein
MELIPHSPILLYGLVLSLAQRPLCISNQRNGKIEFVKAARKCKGFMMGFTCSRQVAGATRLTGSLLISITAST